MILGAGALVLVLGFLFLSPSDSGNSPVGVSNVIASSGEFTYETFSQERFNELEGSEAFAVFFHSESCGTCAKKNKQIIDEVSAFSGGVILKQEFSEASSALRSDLGVTNYDTFVVFDARGNSQTVAGASVNDVRKAIQ